MRITVTMMTMQLVVVVVEMRRRRDRGGQLGVHLHRVRDEVTLVLVVQRRQLLLHRGDVETTARPVLAAAARLVRRGAGRGGVAGPHAGDERAWVGRRHVEAEAVPLRCGLLVLMAGGAGSAAGGTEAEAGEDDDGGDDDERRQCDRQTQHDHEPHRRCTAHNAASTSSLGSQHDAARCSARGRQISIDSR